MQARIRKLVDSSYQFAINIGNKLADYFLADLEKLNADVIKEGGIGVVSMGPRHLAPKLAVVKPSLNTTEKLKTILELKEKDARSPYLYFGFFIGSNFFLSGNSDEDLQLRKKIVPRLHPKNLEIDYVAEADLLLKRLICPHDQNKEEIILNYFLDLFSKKIVGVSLSSEMCKTLCKIEDVSHSMIPLFLNQFPRFMASWYPPIRSLQAECEKNIKEFLYDQITLLQSQELKNELKTNWLVQIIAERFHKTPNQLSSEEMDEIVVDSELRSCFGVILGVSNLARAMVLMMGHLFENSAKSLKQHDRLCAEIKGEQTESIYLHAVYLETLRHFMKDFFIPRYTAKGIKELNIPPRSYILYTMGGITHLHATGRYPALEFWPERFLDDNNKLNQEAKLGSGLFTPFGLGPRPCPGSHLMESIFKNFLCQLVGRVKYFDQNTVTLDESRHTRAESVIQVTVDMRSIPSRSLAPK